MKSKVIKYTMPFVEEKYGRDIASKVLDVAEHELDALVKANAGESKAVKKHTVLKIYPTIALYRGLQEAGVNKVEAEQFLDMTTCKGAEGKARAMQMMCKVPIILRKMPSIFTSVTKKEFGKEQGFDYEFYDTPKTRCKFDMKRCLYCDVCKKNGCFELVKCFCHTDDVTDGNIHPRLKWNRTKTMGEGGDVCDFDLILDTDESKK